MERGGGARSTDGDGEVPSPDSHEMVLRRCNIVLHCWRDHRGGQRWPEEGDWGALAELGHGVSGVGAGSGEVKRERKRGVEGAAHEGGLMGGFIGHERERAS